MTRNATDEERADHDRDLRKHDTNWRPMVHVDGGWHGNALVFATKAEAEANARDLMYRWTLVVDSRADPTNEPVNYRWVGGKLESPMGGTDEI